MFKQTPFKKALCTSILVLSFASISHVAVAARTFTVSGVPQNDVLNLRTGPGTASDVVAHIPPGGSAIMLTGQENRSGRTTWVEVNWQGMHGWVNKRYLSASSASLSVPTISRNTSGDSHRHPKNKCTNSITHSHPNGKRSHAHRYSCQGNGRTARTQRVGISTANSHRHPAHKCTRSVTHSHPNGKRPHQHRYSCNRNSIQNAPSMQQMRAKPHNVQKLDPNAHTHPANRMTRSRTHTHPNGAKPHKHKYLSAHL